MKRKERITKLRCMYSYQQTFLTRVDALLDRYSVGVQNEDDVLAEYYRELFSKEPLLWTGLNCGRSQAYGSLFAKFILLYYLCMPQIPDDAKRELISHKIDPISKFHYVNAGYNTSKILEQLFLAYVKSTGLWEICDIPVSFGDYSEDDGAISVFLSSLPEWFSQDISEGLLDIIQYISEYMPEIPVDYDSPYYVTIWESHTLYDILVPLTMYPTVHTLEEQDLLSLLSRLDEIIFRENMLTYESNVCFLDHVRHTFVVSGLNGYECIGDNEWTRCETVPQLYRYNWFSIYMLEKIVNYCKKKKI